jgi:hypothetical protein
MSAAGVIHLPPSVAGTSHVSAAAWPAEVVTERQLSSLLIGGGSGFLGRFAAEREARRIAEEGIARNYVARLREDFHVEILSQGDYEALSPFERSVEGSCSEVQTGTFRTLAALGFKQYRLEKYLDAVGQLGFIPSEPPLFHMDMNPVDWAHFDLCHTIIEFHNSVRTAIQTFGKPPLQRSDAAPPL